MNRITMLLAIAAIWAAIYLPGLGDSELKGEEGRRILPAIAMLETGNWLVPEINGKPYFRKPPLINWAIAISMEATGERNEFAARLPSVLGMLALAVALGVTGSRWLGNGGGFVAATFMLTSVAFVEKGRLAEIEALYVALTGIAFAWWMAAWARRETGLKLWLVPGIALGLGILLKGPVPHLLFFYGLVIPLLWRAGEKRELWSRGHLFAIVVMFGLVLPWWVPYHAATKDLNASAVMAEQIAERVGGGAFKIVNIPRAFSNGLPWILFALLWWSPRVVAAVRKRDERLALMLTTLRLPIMIGFIGLMLIKGMLPRYTLPLVPPLVLLLALVVPEAGSRSLAFWRYANRVLIAAVAILAIASPWVARPAVLGVGNYIGIAATFVAIVAGTLWIYRQRDGVPTRLAGGSALCIAGAVGIYAFAVLPRAALEDDQTPVGDVVHAEVPEGSTVFVVDPGYESSLFYVRRPIVYVRGAKNLPPEAGYVLLRRNAMEKGKTRLRGASEPIHLRGEGKKEFLLLKLSPEREKTPRPNPIPGEGENLPKI